MVRPACLVTAILAVTAPCACVNLGALEGGSSDGGTPEGSTHEGGLKPEAGGADAGNDAPHNPPPPHDASMLEVGKTEGDASTGGGDGAPPIGCPESETALSGRACRPLDLVCEYGTSPSPMCNLLFECEGGSGSAGDATWVSVGAPTKACPVGCPADYPKEGATCPTNDLACAYTEGTCFCTTDADGIPTANPAWDCSLATPACPSPRPTLGASCTTPGPPCDYGPCVGGLAMECSSGYWKQVMMACEG